MRSVARESSSSEPSKNSQPTTGLVLVEPGGWGKRIFLSMETRGRSQAFNNRIYAVRGQSVPTASPFIRQSHIGVIRFLPGSSKHFYCADGLELPKLGRGNMTFIDKRASCRWVGRTRWCNSLLLPLLVTAMPLSFAGRDEIITYRSRLTTGRQDGVGRWLRMWVAWRRWRAG